MELPLLARQIRQVQRKDSRHYGREVVNLRMLVADKEDQTIGLVIDLTTRGCGLRITTPLRRGQYLTLKLYPDDGTDALICDLVKVQWVDDERAGVAFLCMSLANELRLHQFCAHQLALAFRD